MRATWGLVGDSNVGAKSSLWGSVERGPRLASFLFPRVAPRQVPGCLARRRLFGGGLFFVKKLV